MKVLDEITNKVIKGPNAIKIKFHAHHIDKNCLTMDDNFNNKTIYVDIKTAESILELLESTWMTSEYLREDGKMRRPYAKLIATTVSNQKGEKR